MYDRVTCRRDEQKKVTIEKFASNSMKPTMIYNCKIISFSHAHSQAHLVIRWLQASLMVLIKQGKQFYVTIKSVKCVHYHLLYVA